MPFIFIFGCILAILGFFLKFVFKIPTEAEDPTCPQSVSDANLNKKALRWMIPIGVIMMLVSAIVMAL